jgi:hypothetical protein
MTDEKVLKQLKGIRNLAWRDFPYPGGNGIDRKLLLALGQIARLTDRVIDEYRGRLDGAKSATAKSLDP